MKERLEELERVRAEAAAGGGEARVAKQHAKGKQTARERIDALVDPGSFREVDAVKVHRATELGMDTSHILGDGAVTGFARIDDRPVCLFAQDFTVYGGTLSETVSEKICKIMDMALKVGAPLVALNDSGGARIQEGSASLRGYGDIFYRNVQASGHIPQIACILGPCAGGAVYSPALMDFIVMVDKTSHMFITGPQVIKAVTFEDVTFDDLGGAKAQSERSGVAHFAAQDEEAALDVTRRLLSYLPSNHRELPPRAPSREPAGDAAALADLLPQSARRVYDVRQLLELIVDEGSLLEVQPRYARNVVTAFARLGGASVGIVANNPKHLAGCLDINASDKAARFVRLCDCFNVPIVSLVDVPGFLPGTSQEHGGIIRHGAKLLYAYSEATVPLITVITRKAYGGAYIAMASQHLGADLNLAWPTAEIAVMGPQGAVDIIYRKEIAAAEDPAARQAELADEYERRFASPYVAAKRGFIDEVIAPHETRDRLLTGLQLLSTKRKTRPPKHHGNIPV